MTSALITNWERGVVCKSTVFCVAIVKVVLQWTHLRKTLITLLLLTLYFSSLSLHHLLYPIAVALKGATFYSDTMNTILRRS